MTTDDLPVLVLQAQTPEYLLTLPSNLRMDDPHPELICLELFRKGADADLEVEVFEYFEDYSVKRVKKGSFSTEGTYLDLMK